MTLKKFNPRPVPFIARETVVDMAEQPGEPIPAASKFMEIDSDGEDGATPAEIKARIERDVDELFRSKTIDEVAEIEKKTRQQAEAMDEDIRRTIGGSWREFMQRLRRGPLQGVRALPRRLTRRPDGARVLSVALPCQRQSVGDR